MPSKIEWTDETWNPVTGCTKVSAGCKNCYAARMAKRLAGRCGYPEAPHQFDVTLHPDKLDLPLKWRKPRMVFVCSMGDLFHDDVPFWFVRNVWGMMALCPQHTFQVLTKRPKRMLEFVSREWVAHVHTEKVTQRYTEPVLAGLCDVLPNVWLGTSVENQATADERIPLLLQTPAAVRFVSAEPLLEAVDLSQPYVDYLEGWDVEAIHVCGGDERVCYRRCPEAQQYQTERLDWIIVGGESGPGARPMKLEWARSLVQQCKSADVPIFVKQMGTVWAKHTEPDSDWHSTVSQRGDIKGHDMQYWPEDLQVREMPAQAQAQEVEK